MVDVGKAIWYRIIHAGIESGYSAYRVLRVARSLGLKIRTQTFYRMWHEVLDAIEASKFLQTYPEEKPIPWWRHPRTEYNFPSKYGYVVEVTEAITGEKRTFGIYKNRTLSLSGIKKEAEEIALAYYGLTIKEVRLINLWRR